MHENRGYARRARISRTSAFARINFPCKPADGRRRLQISCVLTPYELTAIFIYRIRARSSDQMDREIRGGDFPTRSESRGSSCEIRKRKGGLSAATSLGFVLFPPSPRPSPRPDPRDLSRVRQTEGVNAVNQDGKDVLIKALSLDQGLRRDAQPKRHVRACARAYA